MLKYRYSVSSIGIVANLKWPKIAEGRKDEKPRAFRRLHSNNSDIRSRASSKQSSFNYQLELDPPKLMSSTPRITTRV